MKEPPGWLTELPARNFKVHVSRNFLTGNFQSIVSLLNGAALQEFVLPPSGSLREVSEVQGGIAAPEGPAAPSPKQLWPPLPHNSPGGLICLKRVERESPPRAQLPDLACTSPLPSSLGTYPAWHWTGHPHSGQINSLLPWGERALGVPGWHCPVVSNPPRGAGGRVKGQDECGGAPPRKEAARGHCSWQETWSLFPPVHSKLPSPATACTAQSPNSWVRARGSDLYP